MQITFDPMNPDDVKGVRDLLVALNSLSTGETQSSEAEWIVGPPDTEPKKAAKKKVTKAKTEPANAEPEPEAEAEAEAEAEPDAEAQFSRDDVRTKLKEYAAVEGKEAAIQILKDNDAASITELAEEKFADVIAACE